MESESRSLNIHLGADLKASWVAYCAERGKKPGAAVKEAIEHQLALAAKEKAAAPKVYRQTEQPAGAEPRERFEIILYASEKTAVRERANVERCSMRRWVVDVIRTALTGDPQFGTKEVDALGESNYQLLAIGRNLNQIARRLNEGKRVNLTLEHIKKLSARIDAHTESVSQAIRASLERWNLE